MPDEKRDESSTYPFDTYRDPTDSIFIQDERELELSRRRPKPFDPPRTHFTEEEERFARKEGCYSAAEWWGWKQATEDTLAAKTDMWEKARQAFRDDMRSLGRNFGALSKAWGLIPVIGATAAGGTPEDIPKRHDEESVSCRSDDEEPDECEEDDDEDDEFYDPWDTHDC